MLHLHKILDCPVASWESCLSLLPKDSSQVCFFDIETTGLSAKISQCYLIGAAAVEQNTLILHQWFADDYNSEKEILLSFRSYIEEHPYLIHFNGSSFDLPYLKHRCQANGIEDFLSALPNLDLCATARSMKQVLSLENCRLKTIETKLGFLRRDSFSGKDCIQLYTTYMQGKILRQEGCEEHRDLLLLHNEDDLKGTVLSSLLLSFTANRPDNLHLEQDKDRFLFTGRVSCPYPLPCILTGGYGTLIMKEHLLQLSLPFATDTLKHFFPDYKNYYYLPEEDMAIHKSVASYVDKDHRKKATKETCYISKKDCFVPLAKDLVPDGFPLFQASLKDRRNYLLVRDAKQYFSSHLQEVIFFYLEEALHQK